MRLIFYGELKRRFGDHFDIDAKTVADAIEGFSRQSDWPENLPVRVVGYDEEDRIRSECPEEVHIMPALRGGSGKFFNIIVGAAVIVLAVTNPFGFSAALATSLIVSGSLMVLQGVVGLFQKQPTFNRNEDPDASKYLNPNRNTVQAGTPITLAYGEIDLAGHWLSLQSNSNNLSYGSFPVNPT